MSLPRVSSNPHIRSGATTQLLMFTVILALMPAFGYGIYNFGIRALFVTLVCVASAVLSELVFALITKKKIRVSDLSAVVTGLLLALNLPVSIPFWQAALGSAFAIIVVKELFGGLGKNFMNPALAGRCFLIISFPVAMTNFVTDTYTGATPLALLKSGESVDIRAMVFGNIPGTIGETSMVMILIGACILLLFGVIDLWIPGSYILTFVIFLIIFGGHGFDPAYISAHLAGGGLMLGAFFMATDYVTRPVSKKGQVVFGIFLGIMTGIFRIFGPSAEGVSYAIILGNCIVPLIDKFTVPVPFGLTASEFKKGGR
ncbi:MAG: RnfABCDGE type electron transport complex subunit D [Lachnospiraceae bacterium]|nr:RnfABCDGE type electron transport complex subunit D [Lachnospiraceae bacterium]